MSDQENAMNPDNLYREETITDRQVGTIKRLLPITADGAPDSQRSEVFVGTATLMTPVGTLPLSFEIPAASLREAVANYGPAAEKSLKETMEELKRMQQEQASSLVIPQGATPGGDLPGGGFPGGGMAGGGFKIP